jgi:signal peptidase I
MEDDLDDLPLEPASDQPSQEGGRTKFLRVSLDILETLVFSLLLFVVINLLTARIRVDGMSMEPTLHNGEFIIVNKMAYRLGKPSLGDVIVFHPPRSPEQEYIKRIIGLPGDQVVISAGKVVVNGQKLDEPYIAAPPRYEGNWSVPEDSLFVLGDNRNNSQDSHSWGTVTLDAVVGKAVFVYWPPTVWGIIEHVTPAAATP